MPLPPRRLRALVRRHAAAVLLLGAAGLCASTGAGAAGVEPTFEQVDQQVQAGRLAEAREMMARVLQAHPNSARAHYVEADLLARQGLFGPARDALAAAERLAPGLPFARADATRSLRSELGQLSRPAPEPASSPGLRPADPPITWRHVLLAAIGGSLLAWLLMRTSRPRAAAPAPDDRPGVTAGQTRVSTAVSKR